MQFFLCHFIELIENILNFVKKLFSSNELIGKIQFSLKVEFIDGLLV